jgi:predicted TIM-barrel fold metal-dependent hydrolase
VKRITIEEHFTTEDNLHYLRLILDGKYPVAEVVQQKKNIERDVPYLSSALVQSGILTRLLDVGEGRLREMDEAGIDMQVLNLASPGVQVFDAPTAITLAKKFNNRLADIVGEHPDRFAGLATLPTQDPGESAKELGRSVLELALKWEGPQALGEMVSRPDLGQSRTVARLSDIASR